MHMCMLISRERAEKIHSRLHRDSLFERQCDCGWYGTQGNFSFICNIYFGRRVYVLYRSSSTYDGVKS